MPEFLSGADELLGWQVEGWQAAAEWTEQWAREGSGPEAQGVKQSSKHDAKLKLATVLRTGWQTKWSGREWRLELVILQLHGMQKDSGSQVHIWARV